ncbi:MAG: hypothetical protein IPL32_18710 [Chloracidobacterium sp.]|nr:hypothetical protein [Chloracidobacterium sp.]
MNRETFVFGYDTPDQRDQMAIQNGEEWFLKHEPHVRNVVLCRSRSASHIEPTGSDKERPELWKDIHWLWFFMKTGRLSD